MQPVILVFACCSVNSPRQPFIKCPSQVSIAIAIKLNGFFLNLDPKAAAALQEYPMFHRMEGKKTIEILDKFDDAREVVAALAAEYEACEKLDYLQQAMQVWSGPGHTLKKGSAPVLQCDESTWSRMR